MQGGETFKYYPCIRAWIYNIIQVYGILLKQNIFSSTYIDFVI